MRKHPLLPVWRVMTPRTPSVVASVIVALEALAVLVLAGIQVTEIAQGKVADMASALALVVLTLVLGAGMALFSFGLLRGETWGRSGGTVTQLMLLAIALGAATGQFAHPAIAIVLAIPALIALVAIFSASKQTAAEEKRANEASDSAETDPSQP